MGCTLQNLLIEAEIKFNSNPIARITDFLRKYGTLVFQCKNYDFDREKLKHGHLIQFRPNGLVDGRTITMSCALAMAQANPSVMSAFNDWLDLVKFGYVNDKATLKI